jgi:glycerophosphoryl diester phosphodiesterase
VKAELIAHRGYAKHFPENTLVAFAAALDSGATYIETDIQLSKDGVPVLFHDNDMIRMCGVKGAIHNYTWSQLQQFPASYPDRFGDQFSKVQITPLSDLVTLLGKRPNVTAFIELKRNSMQHHGRGVVLDTVIKQLKPVMSQCVIISFSLEAVLAAHRRHWPRLGVVFDRWKERNQKIVSEIKPEFMFCDVMGLPWWGTLYTGRIKLAVYDIESPRHARRLSKRGVDFIETFDIGEMNRVLKSKK